MAAFAKSWRRGSKPTKEVEATSILPPEREDYAVVAWYRSLRTSHGRGV